MSKKIVLSFSPQMRAVIVDGRKNATSREGKHGEIGDTFTVNGSTYRLTQIMHVYLDTVATEFYAAEGFTSPDLFINHWRQVKGSYDPDKAVYIHFFAAVMTANSQTTLSFAPAAS